MFSERKVAQMAAFILKKQGGIMSHLKLIKLLYLADRVALDEFGFSMSGDSFYSLPNGPILSRTLNLMAGVVESDDFGWEAWISDKENHKVSLRQDFEPQELDYLSRADIDVLNSILEKFGPMDKWQLVAYTHENCEEWKDPNGSSALIPHISIFKAFGRSKEDAAAMATNIEAEKSIDRLFAGL